ncbi:hypothetical protein M0802_009653 [Mischocyttarus mexicanus]|nr:hypothetical protein M0802_009653 [Mischocyttarus mexicanus]
MEETNANRKVQSEEIREKREGGISFLKAVISSWRYLSANSRVPTPSSQPLQTPNTTTIFTNTNSTKNADETSAGFEISLGAKTTRGRTRRGRGNKERDEKSAWSSLENAYLKSFIKGTKASRHFRFPKVAP